MYKRYIHIYSILFVLLLILLIYYLTNRIEGFDDSTYEIPFYIPRKDITGPSIVSGVPLTIYESWGTHKVPSKMRDTIYNLVNTNPEFDYYLYSDENCIEFIEENYDSDVLDAFYTLKPGAYKSDLWRYCVLYKNGGVYLDIKFYTVVPLISLVEKHPILYVKDDPSKCSNLNDGPGIYNAFMVSTPNNHIFKLCISDIVNSCKLKLYKDNVLHITGPCLLGEILRDYSQNYNTQFSLKDDFAGFERELIVYNVKTGEEIIKGYLGYRGDQTKFQKGQHYFKAWNQKNVYNV